MGERGGRPTGILTRPAHLIRFAWSVDKGPSRERWDLVRRHILIVAALCTDAIAPLRRKKMVIHPNRLPISLNIRPLEMRKRKMRNKASEYPYPRQRCYPTYVLYPLIARLSEGQLPHNTVIPDHDERQTGPKMSTVAPPNIPG